MPPEDFAYAKQQRDELAAEIMERLREGDGAD
jgi:hypothetical protein